MRTLNFKEKFEFFVKFRVKQADFFLIFILQQRILINVFKPYVSNDFLF